MENAQCFIAYPLEKKREEGHLEGRAYILSHGGEPRQGCGEPLKLDNYQSGCQ